MFSDIKHRLGQKHRHFLLESDKLSTAGTVSEAFYSDTFRHLKELASRVKIDKK